MKLVLFLAFPIAALCGVSALAGYRIGQHHPVSYLYAPKLDHPYWFFRSDGANGDPEVWIKGDGSCGGTVFITGTAQNNNHFLFGCLQGKMQNYGDRK